MPEKTKRGGARRNAGAKLKYGEKTVTVSFRVPESLASEIKDMVNTVLEKSREILSE